MRRGIGRLQMRIGSREGKQEVDGDARARATFPLCLLAGGRRRLYPLVGWAGQVAAYWAVQVSQVSYVLFYFVLFSIIL